MANNLDFCTFYDEGHGAPLSLVAPKSKYTKEKFLEYCNAEAAEYDYVLGEVKEAHCKWFVNEGFYSFCKPGKGAFPVWYCDINP